MVKAIAYTREIISPDGEAIPCSVQMERIRNFAAENSTEIVAWFADEGHEEDILKRPGIQNVLACDQPCDFVLCDRVWALSRSVAGLEPFLKELDRRGVGFEFATSTWDVVSQQCRRRSRSLPVHPRAVQLLDEAGKFRRYHVARPARLNFVHLVHPVHPSISPRL